MHHHQLLKHNTNVIELEFALFLLMLYTNFLYLYNLINYFKKISNFLLKIIINYYKDFKKIAFKLFIRVYIL